MFLKKSNLYNSVLLGLLVTQSVQAQYVPDEFKHFYDYEENYVVFLLPNDSSYEAESYSNYYGIDKVIDSEALRIAILNSGIKEKYVTEIINAITSGRDVSNSDGITTDFSFEKR